MSPLTPSSEIQLNKWATDVLKMELNAFGFSSLVIIRFQFLERQGLILPS